MKWRPYSGTQSILESNKLMHMNRSIILFSLVLSLSACKSLNYLPKPEAFPYHVKGHIIEMELEESYTMKGEIIEVTEDAVWVLPFKLNEGKLTKIPRSAVYDADIYVALTSNDPQAISTWAGLINFAVLGHGYYGVLTLPTNLLITIPLARDAARGTYRMNYQRNVTWDYLHKFARFPQGLPPEIDRNEIR